jgi:hypothetical protein
MAQLVRSAITIPRPRWRGVYLAGSAGALVLLSGAGSAAAQTGECQWIQRRGPGPRNTSGLSAVWDAQRQRVVIPHGWQSWEWNGDGWVVPRLSTFPPRTTGHGLAFDTSTNRVLMFGGRPSGSPVLAELWDYDGQVWRQLSAPPAPPAPWAGPEARQDTAMTYDAARQRLVLFGGTSAANVQLGDTWEWDG